MPQHVLASMEPQLSLVGSTNGVMSPALALPWGLATRSAHIHCHCDILIFDEETLGRGMQEALGDSREG